MARELTPKTYKRLLKAFTPAEAKESVDKWITDHRKDYSSSNNKLYIDGRAYKYNNNPYGEVSKTLRLAIFTMPVDSMDKFEEINEFRYSVNVFYLRDVEGKEGELRNKRVDALCIKKVEDAEVHFKLLYLKHEGKAH